MGAKQVVTPLPTATAITSLSLTIFGLDNGSVQEKRVDITKVVSYIRMYRLLPGTPSIEMKQLLSNRRKAH